MFGMLYWGKEDGMYRDDRQKALDAWVGVVTRILRCAQVVMVFG